MKRTSKYPLQDMPTFEMQLKRSKEAMQCAGEGINRIDQNELRRIPSLRDNHNKNVESKRGEMWRESSAKADACDNF